MTELHKLLSATAKFVLTLQAHLANDSYPDAVMTAASDANDAMQKLWARAEADYEAAEISDQALALVKCARFALDAANEEDGTAKMASLAAQALQIAHDLIV